MSEKKKEKTKVDEINEEKKDPEEHMNDLQGSDGVGKELKSSRGKTFRILPSSIQDLPKLFKKIAAYEKLGAGKKNLVDEKSIQLMGEIMSMGLVETHPDMTPEKCLKEFGLSDFPAILQVMMDLNDFFVKMREMAMYQKAANINVNGQ